MSSRTIAIAPTANASAATSGLRTSAADGSTSCPPLFPRLCCRGDSRVNVIRFGPAECRTRLVFGHEKVDGGDRSPTAARALTPVIRRWRQNGSFGVVRTVLTPRANDFHAQAYTRCKVSGDGP